MSTKLAQAHGLYLEYSPAVIIIIIIKKRSELNNSSNLCSRIKIVHVDQSFDNLLIV